MTINRKTVQKVQFLFGIKFKFAYRKKPPHGTRYSGTSPPMKPLPLYNDAFEVWLPQGVPVTC